MTEQSIVTSESDSNKRKTGKDVAITEVLQELQQTPREYWGNLVQIIRLFRESVTLKAELSKTSKQQAQEADKLTQQHEALSKLTKEWIEEGDELEQTETWEYLRQALDEDRLSHRRLFP
jgi:lipoprotein NlpI